MDREELQKLLETPLDPDLDYFDATASIEAIGEHVKGLHKLIGFLAQTLLTQGNSILELRREIVEIRADQLASSEEPLIIMPN